MARLRKSSACVTLVLIGAAALAGCSEQPAPGRRNAYASREACLADWNDAGDCDEQQGTDNDGRRYRYWGHSGGGGGSHGGGYGGYGGSDGGSTGHSISHGGFGSHGSSSS